MITILWTIVLGGQVAKSMLFLSSYNEKIYKYFSFKSNMALQFGTTDEFKMIQKMEDLAGYLRQKSYEITNIHGAIITRPLSGSSFYIQDPALTVRPGFFRIGRACRIGEASEKDRGILIKIYGKRYFERLKEDLGVYHDRNNVDITLLLDKIEPEII